MVNAAALRTTPDNPILPPAVPSLSPVAAGGVFVAVVDHDLTLQSVPTDQA